MNMLSDKEFHDWLKEFRRVLISNIAKGIKNPISVSYSDPFFSELELAIYNYLAPDLECSIWGPVPSGLLKVNKVLIKRRST